MTSADISMAEIDIEDNRAPATTGASLKPGGERSNVDKNRSDIAALRRVWRTIAGLWPAFDWGISNVKLTPEQVECVRKGMGRHSMNL